MDDSTTSYALVVNDDPIILMDACAIQEDAGFRFYEASTGDEAKILLAEQADGVTLLFSDVEMPGDTNGYLLAQHVAENWPWIKIVITSGRQVSIQTRAMVFAFVAMLRLIELEDGPAKAGESERAGEPDNSARRHSLGTPRWAGWNLGGKN